MPTWKQIAEAFGRAMNERVGKENHTRFTINSSKTARRANDPRHDFDDNFGDTPESAAYSVGQVHGNENFFVGHDQARESAGTAFPRSSDVSRRISRIEDENSNARLADNFEDAFEETYNRALDRHDRQTARNLFKDDKDLAKRGLSEDDVYEAIQTSRKENGGFDSDDDIRAQMIEELKSGVDLSDFFEKYR